MLSLFGPLLRGEVALHVLGGGLGVLLGARPRLAHLLASAVKVLAGGVLCLHAGVLHFRLCLRERLLGVVSGA